MSSDNIIEHIFTPFQESINSEQDVREVRINNKRVRRKPKLLLQEIRNIMKDIEKSLREIVTTLQIIHRTLNGEESL